MRTKKQRRSIKVFWDTYFECINFIRHFGLQYNDDGCIAPYSWVLEDHEPLDRKTLNEIEVKFESEKRYVDTAVKYGVVDSEEAVIYYDALKMLEVTIALERKLIKE